MQEKKRPNKISVCHWFHVIHGAYTPWRYKLFLLKAPTEKRHLHNALRSSPSSAIRICNKRSWCSILSFNNSRIKSEDPNFSSWRGNVYFADTLLLSWSKGLFRDFVLSKVPPEATNKKPHEFQLKNLGSKFANLWKFSTRKALFTQDAHTRRKANGTCVPKWECSHCTQATSKGLRLNSCTRVLCGWGLSEDNNFELRRWKISFTQIMYLSIGDPVDPA